MKSFIIFDKETLERLYSYQAEAKQLFGGKWGNSSEVVHLEVPQDLDADTVALESFEDSETVILEPEQHIEAVTEERQVIDEHGEPVLDENGEPTYETVVISEAQTIPAVTEERAFTNYRFVIDGALVEQKADKLKQEAISEAYNRMDKDVFDACEVTYGTRRADSATAFYLTWRQMIDNPNAFAAMFGSEQAVIDFATPKLAAAESYAVFRLGRIAQFEAERAAILAGE